jgi:hypothetical protein
MARAYLRYAPADDQRPKPLSPEVLRRAAATRVAETMSWLKSRIPGLDEDQVIFALTTCMSQGGFDGFRTGVKLRENFSFPVDWEMAKIAHEACSAVEMSLKIETGAWALRTGIRFPAKCGDRIEFIHRDRERAGQIISIDFTYAAAVVTPFYGDSQASMDTPIRVFAEEVYANTTRGEYAYAQAGEA